MSASSTAQRPRATRQRAAVTDILAQVAVDGGQSHLGALGLQGGMDLLG